MKIGGFDTQKSPLLIAELGNNHEGDAVLSLKLADAAITAGADVIKIQVIDPGRLVNRDQVARLAQLSRFRLPMEVFFEMGRRVRAAGRLFAASAFDVDSLKAILPHIDVIKIASGDLNFPNLLITAAKSGKPIILSTGMSSIQEIAKAVECVELNLQPSDLPFSDRLALLHCISLYPTPLNMVNLSAIPMLKQEFGVTVGYSDHTIGVEAAVGAMAMGARIVEKHFTLNKLQSEFRDHQLSADPLEMEHLSAVIHAFDEISGKGGSLLNRPDGKMRSSARRSIVAARYLPLGHIVSEDDLEFVRPGSGLAPTEANRLIGQRLIKALEIHEQFSTDFLAGSN
jgi:N-acetylneuraminate synthase/N,N'-diacetyllegionaminate synthase